MLNQHDCSISPKRNKGSSSCCSIFSTSALRRPGEPALSYRYSRLREGDRFRSQRDAGDARFLKRRHLGSNLSDRRISRR